MALALPTSLVLLATAVLAGESLAAAAPLTTLEFRLVGTQLRASPSVVTVPRNVAGSIRVEFLQGDGVSPAQLPAGLGTDVHLEATLRGVGVPAQRLVGELGEPLRLPPLRVVGDYQLDDIKLVRGTNAVLQATPASIPVRVFDEVLVSRVTSRPLALDEIRDKGIAIDQSSFRAVEFDVTLVLRGRSFRVFLPVVAPRARLSTEIIPAAELEARLVEAQRINTELARSATLPPEIIAEMPSFTLNPINFQEVGDGEEEEKAGIPISGLLVIPGNVGFLNQFFSVQLFTENAAPAGSGLSVNHVNATIRLPLGADQVPARSYEQPGDDPLRLARVGSAKSVTTRQPVVIAGADDTLGTADDIARLQPGETGTAEFLVEGLREGLHLLTLDLEAELEGLAAGVTRVRGSATGSVLVRNANFSLTFAHPATVRAGEPYEAAVTLLNTADFEANLVSVSLNRLAISGAVLLSDERVELGNLRPGESATATFRLRAQRTGTVLFSNLTTGDDNVKGRLSLQMGVDERGVPLNSDAIGYPDWVTALPTELQQAANRVLGQALGVATAGRLPEGVRRTSREAVTERVVELAEAGQRIRYDDDPRRVLLDLALDWQGARTADAGFDQILRETHAGQEWRDAMARALESADPATASARLSESAPALAGLGKSWWLAAASSPAFELVGTVADTNAPDSAPRLIASSRSDLPFALAYHSVRGPWLATPPDANLTVAWRARSAEVNAQLVFLELGEDGQGELYAWSVSNVPADATFTLKQSNGTWTLTSSAGLGELKPVRTSVREEAPAVVSVRQDISVVSDRHPMRCPIREYGNWGTVLAVLFNKPMRPQDVEVPSAYQFGDGNGARTTRLQAGRRVCLLQLHRGIASFAARPQPYRLQVSPLPDPRGNVSTAGGFDVDTSPARGVSVRGRVLGLDGQPAARVPVTLTMRDLVGNFCLPAEYRAAQVFTDDSGAFQLDFVLADVGFTIAALDTTRLNDADAGAILSTLLETIGPRGADRPRLEELLREPDRLAAMLRAFNLGEIGEAIAAAEGLDRAVYQDSVGQQSSRVGSELAVVLRFRGRGSVGGRVLAESGASIPAAAVNLFPALDSRELGRGVLSDSDGAFRFAGVPLGEFSVEVETGDGRHRRVTDRLRSTGQALSLDIVVPDQPPPFGSVRGRVLELDGTPHGGARVFVADEVKGDQVNGIFAEAIADADGFFVMARVPAATCDLAAISADGGRRAVRSRVRVAEGETLTVTLQLEVPATVRGVVRYWDGTPAANAKVGGGDRVVRTGANGLFELSGVPPGMRTILAGVDALEARDNVTRTGQAQLNVRPGFDNAVDITLNAAGRIRGVVYDATGTNRIPNVRVAIPQTGGFAWVKANANGEYAFNAWPLGSYLVSAPAPPVKQAADALAQEALDAIGSASGEDSIHAAAALVGDLASVYVQGTIGRLAAPEFNPGSWGFNGNSARLDFDGQTVVANIRYLASAGVSGIVVNSQDVPIGAMVTVRGLGPDKTGRPAIKEFADLPSDPTTGRWGPSGFLVGPFSVAASSPLLVGHPVVDGLLTPETPFLTNVVVKFPPQQDVTGRLTGYVYNPDGTPVARGAVHIDLAADYAVLTDTNGFFDTQLRLPVRDYQVIATNLDTTLVGAAQVRLQGGVTNTITVHLLDKGSLRVRVLSADGRPAPRAIVELQRYNVPKEAPAEVAVDSAGEIVFGSLYEGDWQVHAEHLAGANLVIGNAGVIVQAGITNEVTLTLGASGQFTGQFLEDRTGAPIPGAQVWIHRGATIGPVFGSTPTDAAGVFAVSGIPLGDYTLVARNPVNGRLGMAEASLRAQNEVQRVVLVEQPLGSIVGTVLVGDGQRGLAGVEVAYSGPDRLTPSRKVTTGPNGAFSFPGVPLGIFHIDAQDALSKLSASVSGSLVDTVSPLRVDLRLPALTTFEVSVWESDGVHAATNATVRDLSTRGIVADTDLFGRAILAGLQPGVHEVEARSTRAGDSSSSIRTNVVVSELGERRSLRLQLSGVGRLHGLLTDADGRPAADAPITLSVRDPRASGNPRRTVSSSDGTFEFPDLPLAPWDVVATRGGLAARAAGEFTRAGETLEVSLRLGGSGVVLGTLAREEGGDVRNVEVTFQFTAQNGTPGFVRAPTDSQSRFTGLALPIQTDLRLRVQVPDLDGIAARTVRLSTNGETLDLGVVRLDQHAPEIVAVTPANGAADISPQPTLEIRFSEPLNPDSVNTNGVVLMEGTHRVAIDLVLAGTNDVSDSVIRVTPRTKLRSLQTYDVLVLGGDQVDRLGHPLDLGPNDLVGRPVSRTLISRFTVRDYEPPVVLSAFPTNSATEIEVQSPIRFEFNEPVDTNRLGLALFGPQGRVDARVDVNLNLRFVALTPARWLDPNSSYRIELRNLSDLAGNVASPLTNTFLTLDTQGPRVASLRLSAGQRPVANATVQVEASLARPEDGAVVRFVRDGLDLGLATEGPAYRFRIRLPAEGLVRLTAVGVDKAGNAGEAAQLELRVAPNDRPSVTLARAEPASGPLDTGRRFSLEAVARDDATPVALRLEAKGALNFSTLVYQPPNGTGTNLVFGLPADAVAGSNLTFLATVVDDSGAESDPATLIYETRDATAPSLEVRGPAEGTSIDPREPLALDFVVRDNSTEATLTVSTRGAVAQTNRLALALSPNVASAAHVDVPLDLALDGGDLTVVARLVDLAGNSVESTRSYRIRNVRGPRLLYVQTANGYRLPTTNSFSPWLGSVTFVWDKPVTVEPSSTNRLLVRASGSHAPTFQAVVGSQAAAVSFPGPAPLEPGSTVTSVLLPGLHDADGNALRLADGLDLPADGVAFTFRVSRFLGLSVTNGFRVVPGQAWYVDVFHEQPFEGWRIELNGVRQSLWRSLTDRTRFLCELPANATTARLLASAQLSGREAYTVPAIDLVVRDRDADDDGDGLPNGWEADHSDLARGQAFDPFDPADGPADFDQDQLDNLAEFRQGTDPYASDTDHDGLSDGAEAASGSCLDPRVADSDGDGLLDGDDLAPCAAGESLALIPTSFAVSEGQSTTNVVSVLGNGLMPLSIEFALDAKNPSFVSFADFVVTATNAVQRRLLLRPSFADAGSYSLTFRVTARRQFSVITTNLSATLTVANSAEERTTRWARAVSGSWSEATNWTSGVPGVGTNAVIDQPGDYVVRLDADAFVESLRLGGDTGTQTLVFNGRQLTLNNASQVGPRGILQMDESGGTLSGQGGLSLGGALRWQAGTIDGPGLLRIEETGRLTSTTNQLLSFRLLTRTVLNAGEIHLGTSGNLFVGGEGVTNTTVGRLILEGDAGWFWRSGSPAIDNAGTLLKRGPGTNRINFIAVRQRGTLSLEDGELELASGSVQFDAASVNRGHGRLRLTGVTGRTDAALEYPSIVMSNTSLTNESAQAWAELEFYGSTLAGNGEVRLTSRMEPAYGSLLGNGRFLVDTGASLRVGGSLMLVVSRPLELLGRAVLAESSRIELRGGSLLNRGVLQTLGGALIYSPSATIDTFENSGEFEKDGVGVVSVRNIRLANSGRVQVNAGELSLQGPLDQTGRIEVQPDALLSLGAGGTYGPTSFTGGPGRVGFSLGTHDLVGELQPLGGLEVVGGAVTVRNAFRAPVAVLVRGGELRLERDQELTSLDLRAGVLGGAGNISVRDQFQWANSLLAGEGRLLIKSNAVGTVRASTTRLARALDNQGVLTLEQNAFLWFEASRLHNQNRLDLQGDAILRGFGSSTGLLVNDGVLRKGSNTVSFLGVGLHQRGQAEFLAGKLVLDSGTNETQLLAPAGTTLQFTGLFQHLEGSQLGGAGSLGFLSGAHEILGAFAPEGPLTNAGGIVGIWPEFTHASTVALTGGTLRLHNRARLREVTLQGGNLQADQRLTITRSLDWDRGNLTGEGSVQLDRTSTARVRTLQSKLLGTLVENGGEATFEDQARLTFDGGKWRALTGSTNRLNGTVWLWSSVSRRGTLVNDGVLRKEGSGAFDLRLDFEQTGALELAAGAMQLDRDSRWGGAVTIASNTSLTLGAGTNYLTAGVTWAGGGTLRLPANATLQLEDHVSLGDLAAFFSASTSLRGEFTLASGSGGRWDFSGGVINVDGPLDVRGQLQVERNTTVRLDDELRLETGATLINLGQRDGQNRSNIRVRSFTNLGALIQGVPPDVVAPLAPLRIVRGQAPMAPLAGRRNLANEPAETVVLVWTGDPRDAALEWSEDLVTWQPVASADLPAAGPEHRLVLHPDARHTLYFRLMPIMW